MLIWGGLRGGVALALALALPEELAQREFLVALTGGVVLATLLLNATTIGALVRRLGLDQPSRSDRFLVASGRLSGIGAARAQLSDLGLDEDQTVQDALARAERDARAELDRLELGRPEELRVVTGRGLHVERQTYQRLSDAGLLPAAVTRTLLHEVDDEIEDLALHGSEHRLGSGRRRKSTWDDLTRRVVHWLPEPAGEDPTALAYAEATARRLAARRVAEALAAFESIPSIHADVVEQAVQTFGAWEAEAVQRLAQIDEQSGSEVRELHRRQAADLANAASMDELEELSEGGLLPETVIERAGSRLREQLAKSRR